MGRSLLRVTDRKREETNNNNPHSTVHRETAHTTPGEAAGFDMLSSYLLIK